MLFLTVDVLERFPEAREKWQERIPLRARRRVPGHEPRPVPPAAAPRRRSTRTSSRSATPDQSIYGFRGADIRNVLEFERDFPGAYTIALEQNYRSTQHDPRRRERRSSAHNRERKEKNLWSELGDGDPVRVDRGRGRARRGALRRRGDRAARRGGLLGQRGRRLLPHERAEPRARGRARAPGHRVPGDRRPALLRARRDQGPRRVPPGARQPVRRGVAAADREPAAPRHRRHDASRGSRRGPTSARSRSGRRLPRRTWPASARRPQKALEGVPRRDRVAHVRSRWSSRCPELIERSAPAQSGYMRVARGRAHDRGAGAHGEPAGARLGRARVDGGGRRDTTLSAFLQEISLYSDQDAIRGDALARHADDAPQREGPRVPRRLPDRHGGGDLPALALDRGAGNRGGAAPLLCRDDACDGTADDDARIVAHAVRGPHATALPSRFLDELPEQHVERERLQPASWSNYGAPKPSQVAPRDDVPSLSTGDNVRHGTLGEGVVVRIEPGGVVTVRFADDGTELPPDARLRAAREALEPVPWRSRSAPPAGRGAPRRDRARSSQYFGGSARARGGRPARGAGDDAARPHPRRVRDDGRIVGGRGRLAVRAHDPGRRAPVRRRDAGSASTRRTAAAAWPADDDAPPARRPARARRAARGALGLRGD